MNKFIMPSINLFGEGAIESISEYLSDGSKKTCLIVTDRFLSESSAFKRLQRVLMNHRIGVTCYKETKPNPTVDCVAKAYNLIRKEPCDMIISLGGGSAHDLAKAVSIVGTLGGCIKRFEGVDQVGQSVIPIIAINTTSGTGSEVTRFTIITDTERHVKMAIIDDHVVPWISVNDTEALITMPKGLTAATGMDALTHAIEAFISTDATALTNAYALEAIQLIHKHLLKAYHQGQDIEARQGMAEAQFAAGVAFSNASLGFVHAIAHQLGGFYNMPHGLCNAVLLPIVLKAIGERLEGEQLKEICKAFGKDVFTAKNKYVYTHLVRLIETMNQQMNIPLKLRELGVKIEDIEILADNALKDPCRLTSPVQFDQKTLVSMLKAAY
jgi:alcohol dehydrogenase